MSLWVDIGKKVGNIYLYLHCVSLWVAICKKVCNIYLYLYCVSLWVAIRKKVCNIYAPPKFGTLGLGRPKAGQEIFHNFKWQYFRFLTPSSGFSLEVTLVNWDNFVLWTNGIGIKFNTGDKSNPQSNIRVTSLNVKI